MKQKKLTTMMETSPSRTSFRPFSVNVLYPLYVRLVRKRAEKRDIMVSEVSALDTIQLGYE